MNIINTELCFRKGLAYGNNPKIIVLHHADSSRCNIKDIHVWHLNNGWSGCGYHYFIKKNGAIYKGRPDNAIGAHCLSYNSISIGICVEGCYDKENMSKKQYNALIDLIRYLQNKYNIKNIHGHRELNSTDCPGKNFPLSRVKEKCLGSKIFNKRSTSYPGYLLKINSNKRDDNVKLIQNKLLQKGYTVGACGADGYFGKGTLYAVKKFQRKCGFIADGIVGIRTWNQLFK